MLISARKEIAHDNVGDVVDGDVHLATAARTDNPATQAAVLTAVAIGSCRRSCSSSSSRS